MALNALKINWRNEQSEKRPNVLHNSHLMLCYKTGIVLDEIKSFFSISLAFSLCTYCLKVRKIAAAALTELLYKQQKKTNKKPICSLSFRLLFFALFVLFLYRIFLCFWSLFPFSLNLFFSLLLCLLIAF